MDKEKFGVHQSQSFTGNQFEFVDFCDSDFGKKNLNEAIFLSCGFFNKDSDSGCSFYGSKIRNAKFINCDLTLCNFAFADLFGAEFTNCRLIGTSFENASFSEQLTRKKYFCSGKIEDSNLSNASLAGLILENCSLRGNRWYETDITKTDFSGADLSDGEFSGIRWSDGNFTGSDLRGASLQGLDIRKVDLSGVRLDAWQISQLASELGIIVS
ncbi:pentapeptide repeat-containing protein [Xenorhabdus miraniensis]|uniref:Pentapeptide repeat-containing protein n=1 Tax=Xenorhabdus miraniensis TaxID=351674 RepID=A0A2D0JJ81_9GAMM|nr:pentapeptide repeat-containing protein [Xenorhabdus miraniensis]PHM45225.1 hypothetical protein Xmir_04335 [Xenorhabdus miraniensis]